MFTLLFTLFVFLCILVKKKEMATVSIVLRKDKIKANGEIPVFYRIIKNRKISYLSTGISCLESNWDAKNNRIKGVVFGSKETTSRLNGMLYQRFSEIQQEVIYLDTNKREISIQKIREHISGKEVESFYEFANRILQTYRLEDKIGTYDRCKSVIDKLKKYKYSLSFDQINVSFLKKYEFYLRSELGNSTNTISANMKFIRTVFNKAFQEEIIEIHQNPFLKYKIQNAKTQRDYLTEEELTSIENLTFEKEMKMELYRDMFVFSAYAGGLRVSDVLQLQWKHFNEDRIDFTIKKTGSQLSIKLPNKALEIIHKYSEFSGNKNSFIFGCLPAEINLNDAVEVDYEISRATAKINKSLKSIAKKAEIEKNLSFHIARHTWATRALRKGISIDKVSKLMGHAAIKETQIYAKIVNTELDKAMDVFND